MNRTWNATISTAIALVLGSGQASAGVVFSQNAGSVGNNANAGFDFDTWFISEVSLAGTDRFSPTVTLDIFDGFTGSRDLTMHLFAGDGSITAPASGALTPGTALASVTVTTADLGAGLATATTVTWNFAGVVVPTDLIIGIEVANTDSSPTSLAIISAIFSPSVTIGTSHGRNFSNDDGVSWAIQPNNQTNVGLVNFTISASPIPAPGSIAVLGIAGMLGIRRRR